MTKTILGLDLGTNSIGWALINKATKTENDKIIELNEGEIKGLGSRIIPMSQDILGEFDKGNSVSQTASRTDYRGVRRLHERNLLRRERLHRVLNVLGFLPTHFADALNEYGNFKENIETKLPYFFNENGKHEFLFKNSYNEMLEDFKKNQPQLFFTKANGEQSKIPYDWTIYYLRKKALSQKIDKEELAWLLLHFNQKRGYYQLRGEDEVKKEDEFEIIEQKILSVKKGEKDKIHEKYEYTCALENGMTYKASFYSSIEHWVGQTREFILTYKTKKDFKTKIETNEPSLSFLPTINEIEAMDTAKKAKMYGKIKIKTEKTINDSNKTVGAFIYDTLLQQPNQKIKGKLIRTIERNFYKDELQKIIEKQIKFHTELQDRKNYKKCCDALYKNNDAYKKSIAEKDFKYLFVDDILFYQRPLKSKKSEISDCTFEKRPLKDKDGKLIKNEDGSQKTSYLKCIAKSHPLFQEFRIWQWMSNVKIFERYLSADKDVTHLFLKTEKDYENLFNFLNEKKEIDQTAFLKYILEPQKLKGKALTTMLAKYRWNYIDDNEKTYPCNKTRNYFVNKLGKEKCNVFLTQELEIKIWQALYSIKTKEEADKAFSYSEKRIQKKQEKAIKKNKNGKNDFQYNLYEILIKNGFDNEEILSLSKTKFDEKQYGTYSEKAIKKLLPLMRLGKYWDKTPIIENMALYQKNKETVIETINKRENKSSKVKDELIQLDADINAYKGLRKEMATYLVYQIHSETSDKTIWETPQDIADYLDPRKPNHFKQHSLRNPIVEQVLMETLRVVKDIWVQYGESKKYFFDEIRIELGREMKNNAEDRKAITESNLKNENTNLRIRAMLAEFANIGIESVKPESPYQHEALKIFEDGILKSYSEEKLKEEKLEGLDITIPEVIKKFNEKDEKKKISKQEILKYRLWLEQKYESPYTNQIIPLSKLFTAAYEIEHIIPKSVYLDDSFSNKVICESVVNKKPYKDNQFGLEFIKNQGSTIVTELCTKDKTVKIKTEEEYRKFIETHYANNKAKAKKLLLEEVPEKMIERQLNDTRYISKVVKNLLSKIVRSNKDDDSVTSKNVLSTNGTITSILKQDWGLNNIWNDLMLPRFKRLNELTKTEHFTYFNEKYQKYLPTVPDKLRKGFQLKRIDHRHHAMDALVIACTTRSHINYLNNDNALNKNLKGKEKTEEMKKSRKDLKKILCYISSYDDKGNPNFKFHKPWKIFTTDAKENLEKIIISIKQNSRVINKTVNFYQKFVDGKKEFVKQTKGDNWAIRKPLHTPMPYGKKTYDFDVLKISENIGKKDFIIDEKIKLQIIDLLTENGNAIGKVQAILKKNPLLDVNEKPILETAFETKNTKFRKRKPITDLSNRSSKSGITTVEQMIKILNKIADFNLRQNLLNHLKENNNDIDIAFSPAGIEKFNLKRKIPVYKLPIAESSSSKFKLGNSIGTKYKYAEAETGTNLYFAIYTDEKGKRNYDTIPLNIVIERLKQGLPPVPEKENNTLLFWLSPNDLVYIPTNIAAIDFNNLNKEQVNRIYKMVSSTGNQCMFIKADVATSIYNKVEFSSLNKMEKSIDGIMIKEHCIKLDVDRLGFIKREIK